MRFKQVFALLLFCLLLAGCQPKPKLAHVPDALVSYQGGLYGYKFEEDVIYPLTEHTGAMRIHSIGGSRNKEDKRSPYMHDEVLVIYSVLSPEGKAVQAGCYDVFKAADSIYDLPDTGAGQLYAYRDGPDYLFLTGPYDRVADVDQMIVIERQTGEVSQYLGSDFETFGNTIVYDEHVLYAAPSNEAPAICYDGQVVYTAPEDVWKILMPKFTQEYVGWMEQDAARRNTLCFGRFNTDRSAIELLWRRPFEQQVKLRSVHHMLHEEGASELKTGAEVVLEDGIWLVWGTQGENLTCSTPGDYSEEFLPTPKWSGSGPALGDMTVDQWQERLDNRLQRTGATSHEMVIQIETAIRDQLGLSYDAFYYFIINLPEDS